MSSTFDLDVCLDCHTRLLDVLDLTFASGRTEPYVLHTVAEALVHRVLVPNDSFSPHKIQSAESTTCHLRAGSQHIQLD